MTSSPMPSRAFHIALWTAQVALAVMMGMAGFMKASQPIEQLSQTMPWTAQLPEVLVRVIAIAEILGAFGLLLPALFRVRPILTPIAALGLAVIQVLAIVHHVSKGEVSVLGLNLILLLTAAFIAWGRSQKVPISSKTA